MLKRLSSTFGCSVYVSEHKLIKLNVVDKEL